ncbi:chemotaxis protein CheW [Vibrio sp. NTOU-M3]|uniref:chemotaxis protein CheW n=1 Tax=Vibrio sp. NTOU-M3 TaxID=3234954 RepID=UPI00349F559F
MDETEEINNDALDLLFVEVAQEVVALPIETVKEVIEYSEITRVPMCPLVIRGVINVRGSVVPVIDAASRLTLTPPERYDRYSCIVLYETPNQKSDDSMTLGLVVSRVRSIKSVDSQKLMTKPQFGLAVPTDFVWKILALEESSVPILDMSALLSSQDINSQMLHHQVRMLAAWEA